MKFSVAQKFKSTEGTSKTFGLQVTLENKNLFKINFYKKIKKYFKSN